MITEKLMMPYILATLHPIMHATCLVTTLIMTILLDENDETNFSTCTNVKDGEEEEKLQNKTKKAHYWAIAAHAICFFLHLGKKYTQIYQTLWIKSGQSKKFTFGYLYELMLLIKVFLYIVTIIYIQTVISDIFEACPNDKTNGNNHLVCWLLYEVVIFYFNAIGQCIFLLVSRCRSYITIKERVGLCT